MSKAAVSVIGAGPAGLIAAERLARAGAAVVVHDRMPSVARKFLMAGRGGLNLTPSEPLDAFLPRYGGARDVVAPWLAAFSPADLTDWAEALGQPTFVGTSGRVFPRALKASPLLRAWLARLDELGVTIRTRSTWKGWRDGALVFDTPEGERRERPDAVLLALGGASWPRLGSDAAWTPWLEAAGVSVAPFRPTNVGVTIAWSSVLRERFPGAPLKGIALTHGDVTVRGEAVIADYGLEGGAVYALSAAIRETVARDGRTTVCLDLKPDVSLDRLAARLAAQPAKASLSNRLRKAAGLDPARPYLTNTVKHFKFEARGKRRLHQRASAGEQAACRPWLAAELDRLPPRLVVALGAMASQTLLGNTFRLTTGRGQLLPLGESDTTVVTTWHPSAILRARGPQREEMHRQLLDDLQLAAEHVRA